MVARKRGKAAIGAPAAGRGGRRRMLLATCEGDECPVSARCDARQSNLRLFLGKFVNVYMYMYIYIMKQAMLKRQCARTGRRAMCELDAAERPV